jgi:phosphatidylinositol alpha-1,6-mannosyltransferase
MRILFLTDSFLPHAGGSRVYYHHLLRGLHNNPQNAITILTKKVDGWRDFDRAVDHPRFRIFRAGRPLPNWRYQQWPKIASPFLYASALLMTKRYDLIHCGDLYPQGVVSLAFRLLLRKPYVAYCHGEEITQTEGRRFQPRVRDAIYRHAQVVVAANEFARQNLLRIGVAKSRIRKITPGVDCARFKPADQRQDLLERFRLRGRFVLLTVGRLVPRKGHEVVLRALSTLLPEKPNIAYLIVGTGPDEAKLRQTAAELGLSHLVHFVGFVKDEDLPDYYNLADLFVLPNSDDKGDMEGFGMVFLEANACGKPVIGGRSGGTSEAVLERETGMLVDPDNPAELARTLKLLMDDVAFRTKLGQNGLRRAASDFRWSARVQSLEDLNREVLGLCKVPNAGLSLRS